MEYIKQIKIVETTPCLPGCIQEDIDLTNWMDFDDFDSSEDIKKLIQSINMTDSWNTKKIVYRFIEKSN